MLPCRWLSTCQSDMQVDNNISWLSTCSSSTLGKKLHNRLFSSSCLLTKIICITWMYHYIDKGNKCLQSGTVFIPIRGFHLFFFFFTLNDGLLNLAFWQKQLKTYYFMSKWKQISKKLYNINIKLEINDSICFHPLWSNWAKSSLAQPVDLRGNAHTPVSRRSSYCYISIQTKNNTM